MCEIQNTEILSSTNIKDEIKQTLIEKNEEN